jgi:hypothetical protein
MLVFFAFAIFVQIIPNYAVEGLVQSELAALVGIIPI